MKYESNRPPMAVILAAGIGTRLSPLTDKSAKSLLSVGGSVILERMIRNCLSCGISQFVLVLGHRADEIKQFVDKTFRGIRVTYVTNDRYALFHGRRNFRCGNGDAWANDNFLCREQSGRVIATKVTSDLRKRSM